MVRKNCYKYNNNEISVIVNEYLNSRITFADLAKKYNRCLVEVMNLVRDHYEMDNKKTSARYFKYKRKNIPVMVIDDSGRIKKFANEQKCILWFMEFGYTAQRARQVVRRALDGGGSGKYMNLQITYI